MNIVIASNTTGVMPVFQWMRHPRWMFSPRNSVRVVLLIARGWRGTSLPRVNIRKEIQRHRCWAFSEKACSQWTLLWRITLRKRNTDGVERNHLQNKMGGNTAWYVGKHNAIFIILRSKLHQIVRWNDANGAELSPTCSPHFMFAVDGTIEIGAALPIFYSPRFASSMDNGLWVSTKGG